MSNTLNELARTLESLRKEVQALQESHVTVTQTPIPPSRTRHLPPNVPSEEWVLNTMLGALGKKGPLSVQQLAAECSISSAWCWKYIWALEAKQKAWIRKTQADDGKPVYYIYHGDSIIAA